MRILTALALLAAGTLSGSAVPSRQELAFNQRFDAVVAVAKPRPKVYDWQVRYQQFSPPKRWEEIPAPRIRVKVKKVRPARHHPRVHAAPAQEHNFLRGFIGGNFDPMQWALNQGIGYIPGPSSALGGYVYGGVMSAAVNVIYVAAVTSIKEGRELGHGEACGIILDSLLNPTPFPIWGRICNEIYKNIDLCKIADQHYRETVETDMVPREARVSWYREEYCDGPVERKWDVFRPEAGKPPRALKRMARR